MNGADVLFYVQHLLGIGHVMRAATLARAMTRRGLGVVVVSGGDHVPVLDAGSVDFVQLPPVRADDRFFKVLVDETGAVVDDAWKADRRDRLLAVFEQVRPRVLVLELFPFGRRQLRFELIPLLEAAGARRPRPWVVSSVRDILVEKAKPERNAEMVELAERYLDAVLVHGDPGLIPFEATFPHAGRLGERLCYTGYVVDRDAARATAAPGPRTDVVVSAGGGAVSESLLDAALGSRPLTVLKHAAWRFLVGHNLPEDRFRAFREKAPAGVVVERARPDFPALLANCRVSVSQGGYNTVMEVLATGARGVIVPYAGGEETEQTIRARLLAERGLVRVVEEEALDPRTLAAAVDAASVAPLVEANIRMDGAETAARIVAEMAGAGGPAGDGALG